MSITRTMATVLVACLSVGTAIAQPGPGMGPGPMAGAGPASAPGRGMGPGSRWGADFTPGWSLMSPEERNQHRDQMRAVKTYDECKSLQAQHREAMAARASASGVKALPTPRRDPCAGLPR